jgi:hypothetical protein
MRAIGAARKQGCGFLPSKKVAQYDAAVTILSALAITSWDADTCTGESFGAKHEETPA